MNILPLRPPPATPGAYRGVLFAICVTLVLALATGGDRLAASEQPPARGGGAPQATSARASAPVDLTGHWVSLVTEDWRFRMVTPPKGDYASLPLNAEGRKLADSWDPSKEGSCEAYGAGAIMRMPGRIRITWDNDTTLKVETDAGQQTRLFRFGALSTPAGERSWQGQSAAEWVRGGGGGRGGNFGAFGGLAGAPGQARWAPLKVVTTNLRPGWLRKNGAPYSENAVITESFLKLTDEGEDFLTVVTTVDDPKYLTGSLITSSNFKKEPDGSKWKPTPCRG